MSRYRFHSSDPMLDVRNFRGAFSIPFRTILRFYSRCAASGLRAPCSYPLTPSTPSFARRSLRCMTFLFRNTSASYFRVLFSLPSTRSFASLPAELPTTFPTCLCAHVIWKPKRAEASPLLINARFVNAEPRIARVQPPGVHESALRSRGARMPKPTQQSFLRLGGG